MEPKTHEYRIHVCARCGVQLHSASIREDDDDPESWGHPIPGCWPDEDRQANVHPEAREPLFEVKRIVLRRVRENPRTYEQVASDLL